jgi:esterase/lipase superfamily enzyme
MMLGMFWLPACGQYLMPTPNLYRQIQDPFNQVPAIRRGPDIPILFATDRAVNGSDRRGPVYGVERSSSLAFGQVTVQMGPDQPWNDLVAASRVPNSSVRLRVTSRVETGRFLPRRETAQQRRNHAAGLAAFRATLVRELQTSGRKDVYVYVHGFNNEFDEAAMVMAELWHFMGRVGVPVVYSWPAGRDGIFGYETDHDSAQFTVRHLRQFLTAIAETPEVERIHLLAFSTGAPATLTALRELHLQHTAAGEDTQKTLKLENLVLVAADFDSSVFDERILAEGLHRVPRRFTIYTAAGDWAMRASQFIHGGLRRLGGMDPKAHDDLATINLLTHPELHMILVAPFGPLSHRYFVDHPAVSSDLILLLRDSKNPGAQNGRPLRLDTSGSWWLDNNYPQFKKRSGRRR